MSRAILNGCIVGLCLMQSAGALQVSPAHVQPDERPWWVSGEMGDGQIELSSDQLSGNRVSSFAAGFAGGRKAGDFVRMGVKLNGWLLQASNLYDPTVGENVSNVMGIADVFASRRIRLFARGGLGWASYTNNRPTGSNGNGMGWETGAGYEFPLGSQLRLGPIVEYDAGRFGDSQYSGAATGRRYSVIEFKLAVMYRFGGHRR